MDDFRTQLTATIEAMLGEGIAPAFLVVDLEGADYIKKQDSSASLEKFKAAALRTIASATDDSDAFTYGEDRIVVILGAGWERLKTFALIQKLRRAIPLLGQSFDVVLQPQFDVIDYDPEHGAAGLIKQIVSRRHVDKAA